MACLGGGSSCAGVDTAYFDSAEDEKLARTKSKQIDKFLKEQHRHDLRQLKILLLGTGESGKSTITKQMKIIHIDGFETRERLEKINDIRSNIKESIVVILCAMQQLGIELERPETNTDKMAFILREAASSDHNVSDEFLSITDELWQDQGVKDCYSRSYENLLIDSEFLSITEELWEDQGVKDCYSRSYEYQLIDSAKYFLDKIREIRCPDYIPSDQDILRCRVLTTSIQHIEFDVRYARHPVSFSVFDVGGQRGERRKWIQVFDSVVAILFLADCSSYDQTLREDRTTNRFIEALEIFEQVWKNRFLRNVSVILFMNKMDILAEKVQSGRCIADLTNQFPAKLPSYDKFTPSNSEKIEFLESYNKPGNSGDGEGKKRRGSRSNSKSADVNPEFIKTAVYIKHIFMKIVKGDIMLKPSVQEINKDWHNNHSCEYFYTCAVDTNNIQRVLTGCRTLIIRKHLERFGIL